jgi:hypothetical protein
MWVSRTPVTNALAYRTLAVACGHPERGTIEWRTTELMRRYALDHAAVNAAARQMLEEELKRFER